uniref:Uncharacterized protein n=1 Tax=Tanacetum cinerariifolium TaxID=118510 RepID=A0A6L2M5Z4_TANCI|nr:hypothetical protein [Tanacetum cinerariifolium]
MKCVGEGSSVVRRKKRACKANEAAGSEFGEIVFVTPMHQAYRKLLSKTITSHPNGIAGTFATGSRPADTGKEVIRFTPFIMNIMTRTLLRAATPVEDEVLSSLSNSEVVRRTYQFLGRSILSQAELFKREIQTNDRQSKKLALIENAHSQYSNRERELMDGLKDMDKETDNRIKTTSDQFKGIKKLEEDIRPKSKQLSDAEERVMVLDKEKTELVVKLAQAKMVRHKVIRVFVPAIVSRLHSSVEYHKSLVVHIGLCFTTGWLGGLGLGCKEEEISVMLANTSDLDIKGSKVCKDKNCKLFMKQYPYVQKVVDSYRLPLDDLTNIFLNVPPPTDDQGRPSFQNVDGGSTNPNLPDSPLA